MKSARPFVLLAVAVVLAPLAEASRTTTLEPSSAAAVALAKVDATTALTAIAPASGLETSRVGEPVLDDRPRFDLGDVSLAQPLDERVPTFHLGAVELLVDEPPRGPPASYPETRVRGLELLAPFRVGASPALSLWSHQACGFSCPGIASDSRQDPWGLCAFGLPCPTLTAITDAYQTAASEALNEQNGLPARLAFGTLGVLAAPGAGLEQTLNAVLETPNRMLRSTAGVVEEAEATIAATDTDERIRRAAATLGHGSQLLLDASLIAGAVETSLVRNARGTAGVVEEVTGPPTSRRGSQTALSRPAEQAVSRETGVPLNRQGAGAQTIPGSGDAARRVPDLQFRGPGGSLQIRGSIVEVKAKGTPGVPFGKLSAHDRSQLADAISYVQRLRNKATLVKDPVLRERLEAARVELFTDAAPPRRGKYAEFVRQGLLEIKPIPR